MMKKINYVGDFMDDHEIEERLFLCHRKKLWRLKKKKKAN
jgi:hypothetical protein